MDCAHCGRPPVEHTVMPDRGHPENGCQSFAFSIHLPSAIARLECVLDVMKRRDAGEVIVHCHCLAMADLKPCSNCGYLLCPRHHPSHEASCTLPKDSRHPGMPYSQPKLGG